MKNLTKLAEWQTLLADARTLSQEHMRHWFLNDQERFNKFTLRTSGILLDYSRNRINEETVSHLCQLADACHLRDKIAALMSGGLVNTTENRPALHTALRDQKASKVIVGNENIISLISNALAKMHEFVKQIHTKKWLGTTGKAITHIVNIGIGGSHLGPKMTVHALKDYAISPLKFHFISSTDPHHVNDILQQIELESTLFIISSKSFSTLETISNAKAIMAMMKEKFGAKALEHHFIAITARSEKAKSFGINPANIFPIWDWVGGRYSIWSAIGLPLMLMIGDAQFQDFLAGAHEMDEHFRTADFSKNMPVLLALLDIWYSNFFESGTKAIIPYAHRLRYFIPYLQQAEMESNGKQVNIEGQPLSHRTGSVIFGEEGCDGQHAYHQLLHQGQHLIPVDFIVTAHDPLLLASALSQAQALMRGKTYDEAYSALIASNYSDEAASELAKHQVIPGNRPSNILFLDQLSPRHLGALIALYEHKIFVEGAIWNINSFDQWGIELGKQLLPAILNSVENSETNAALDSATLGLIQHYKTLKDSS